MELNYHFEYPDAEELGISRALPEITDETDIEYYYSVISDVFDIIQAYYTSYFEHINNILSQVGTFDEEGKLIDINQALSKECIDVLKRLYVFTIGPVDSLMFFSNRMIAETWNSDIDTQKKWIERLYKGVQQLHKTINMPIKYYNKHFHKCKEHFIQ